MSTGQSKGFDEAALIARAEAAARRAYAPYSKFHVGAAVLLDDGRIFEGCNVENISYGLTNCAERTAIFAAVADTPTLSLRDKGGATGSVGKPIVIRAIAAVNISPDGGASKECSPCGACRQVIAEFASAETVILYRYAGGVRRVTMNELLPDGFKTKF